MLMAWYPLRWGVGQHQDWLFGTLLAFSTHAFVLEPLRLLIAMRLCPADKAVGCV